MKAKIINVGSSNILLSGSKKDMLKALEVLSTLPLTGKEAEDRLKIQDAIDEHNLKCDILYNGNSVWSFKRVIKDFLKILKSDGEYELTDYLYHFFIHCCGSIAHYDKIGWQSVYPTKENVIAFCFKNEYGKDILSWQPHWATDRKRICEEILKLCHKHGGER